MGTDRKEDLGERVSALETSMERLMGNGQPGEVYRIWERLEAQSRAINRGIGAVIAIQAIIGILLALMAIRR